MSDIGKKICEARKSKGLTQEELADFSKVNLRTIQRIENNESEARGKTLNLVCEVLELNLEDLINNGKSSTRKNFGALFTNIFFLVILNFTLMGIFGYLTLDSDANMNSRFGALLLSFFIPLFIVQKTPKMSGVERMLKFGSGFILYILLVLVKHGFPIGFITGLFICLIISLGFLFYGKRLLDSQD